MNIIEKKIADLERQKRSLIRSIEYTNSGGFQAKNEEEKKESVIYNTRQLAEVERKLTEEIGKREVLKKVISFNPYDCLVIPTVESMRETCALVNSVEQAIQIQGNSRETKDLEQRVINCENRLKIIEDFMNKFKQLI